MIGGYANEGMLTAEHLKLPPEMQRRVGSQIKVISVTDDEITYKNTQSNKTHCYGKRGGVWKWKWKK